MNNVQMQHAEKTINTDYVTNYLHDPEMNNSTLL